VANFPERIKPDRKRSEPMRLRMQLRLRLKTNLFLLKGNSKTAG